MGPTERGQPDALGRRERLSWVAVRYGDETDGEVWLAIQDF